MPDGTQVNFPDDMPSEQIKGLIASKFPDIAKSTQEKEQGGFSAITKPISDFIEGQKQRGADLANAVNRQNQEQQNPASTALQFGLHNIVGGLAQIPTAGIEMAGNIASDMAPRNIASDMTPAPIKNAVNDVGQAIAQSPIGQALTPPSLAPEAGRIINAYNQNNAAYAKSNPEAAANFQAIREGVNLLPFAAPEVRAATEAGAEAAGNAIKNVTTDAGKAAITKIAEASKPESMFTSDAVKQMARQSYKIAEEKDGVLTPDFANKFFDSVESMKPQTEHGVATVGENALAKLTDDWKTLKDKPITLQAAQEMDEGLSQRIDSHVDRVTGKLDKEGRQLYDAQTQFRGMIDKASEKDISGGKEGFDALKQGRAYWSTALRIGDMERILTRASMTDNPATSIKAGFRTLYNNPSRMIGYNGAERAAIKRAAQSGVISGTLRTVLGSRLIGTAMGTALGTAGGGFVGGAAGAGIGAGQAAIARAIAAKLQTGRANKVIKTISRRVK